MLSLTLFLTLTAFADDAATLNIENIKNTKRVSIVFASQTDDLSASSFGHVALRFSPTETPGLGDAVIEFVADIPEGENGFKQVTKGIGLPFYAYPVVSLISPFYEFKKINRIGQDRDVVAMEIDMTAEQIETLVDKVINYKAQKVPKNYTFLSKNCSYFILKFLEQSIGQKIARKSHPWKVMDTLPSMGVVTKTTTYSRGTEERAKIVSEMFEKYKINESFPIKSWNKSFEDMVKTKKPAFKMAAYLQLLATYNSPNTPSKTKSKIKRLVRKLKTYELPAFKFVLEEFFKNVDEKIVLPLSPQSFHMRLSKTRKKAVKHKLLIKDDKVFIQVKLRRGQAAPIRRDEIPRPKPLRYDPYRLNLMFEVTDFKFNKETKEITYNGLHIGRHIKSKKLDFILTARFDYGVTVDFKGRTVAPIIYIDPSATIKTPTISYEKLLESGTIALNNMKDFAGSGGTCKAMALLQKALTERVIFLKDGEYGDKIDKIQLIDDVFKGSFAVVSGYSGIKDFTASIDNEKLKTYIQNLQTNDINKTEMAQVLENVQHQTEIESESFLNFQGMLKEGMILSLDVGKFYKGTDRWVKNQGHTIIVYNIEPNGDGRYKVTAYDPNVGLNKLFKLNENFMLENVIYPKGFDFRAAIPKIEQHKIEFDNAVRSREVNYDALKFTQQQGQGTIMVPASKIFRILK
jgi:hypothetical protein